MLIRYTSFYLLVFPHLRVVLHAGSTINTFFKEIPLIEVCSVSISSVGMKGRYFMHSCLVSNLVRKWGGRDGRP